MKLPTKQLRAQPAVPLMAASAVVSTMTLTAASMNASAGRSASVVVTSGPADAGTVVAMATRAVAVRMAKLERAARKLGRVAAKVAVPAVTLDRPVVTAAKVVAMVAETAAVPVLVPVPVDRGAELPALPDSDE